MFYYVWHCFGEIFDSITMTIILYLRLNCILYCIEFVFFIYVFCILLWYIMLAVWWRVTFTMTIVLYLRLNSIWNFCLYLYFVFIYFVYHCGGSRWRCDEERHSPWQWRGAIYIAILSDPGIKERKITIYWQQGNTSGERFFFSQKIEIFGLHWNDMSASFKRFKLGCLYRSQKMLWSSNRGCSSRAL